jgi:N-acetylglutamate synthase-like GNAT family acetyltransferase
MAVESRKSGNNNTSMFTVRRAREEDCEGIWRVHMRAIREIAESHYTSDEIEAWASPRKPEHYIESIKNKEFYVVEGDGTVVGFGTLNQKQNEIEAVYVSPEAARRGVGKAILQKLEERAKDLGIKSLKMDASLNAVPFYECAGYESQREMKHRLSSGVEIGCVLMTKELSR